MIIESFKQGFISLFVTQKKKEKKEQALFIRFNFSQGNEYVQISSETGDLLRAAIERSDKTFEFLSLAKSKRWVNLAKAESVEFYEYDRLYPKADDAKEWVYVRLSDEANAIDLVDCGSGVIESLSSDAEFIKVDDDVYVRRSTALYAGYKNESESSSEIQKMIK